MRLPNSHDPESTNWEVTKYEWKKNNKDNDKIYKNPPKEVFVQPDYTNTIILPKDSWREVV